MEAHSHPVLLAYSHAYVKEKYANLLDFLNTESFPGILLSYVTMSLNSAALREEVGKSLIY